MCPPCPRTCVTHVSGPYISPRKVSKRRRPRCLCPSASLRATCGARRKRGSAELASLRQLRPLSRFLLRSSAQPEGARVNAPWRVLVWVAGVLPLRVFFQGRAKRRPAGYPGPSEAKARWVSGAERSEGPLGIRGRAQRWPDPPLWLRRGAQRFADKGSQLFERNEVERVLRDPAKREHRRLPRSAAKGSQTVGRLFFGYFLLAKCMDRGPG